MQSGITERSVETLRVFKEPLFHAGTPACYHAIALWAADNNQSDLARLAKDAVERIDETESDFNRMCIGPYRLSVPPYESVWRSGGRVLNNRYSAAVAHSYAELGLTISGDFREMSDYIGNELEFLFCLAGLAFHARSEDRGDDERELTEMYRRFWAEHLGHWVYDFLGAVQADAREAFWREWSRVLAEELGREFFETALSPYMSGTEKPVALPSALKEKKD